ncbi:GNAT family N-acetyltransferase [Niallia nealsonii]|uniref:GNAT family N-acetyltransferase n=1 Tax=Niallia nealsonii TaxID=115979 RepID=A0A2N0Z816_9BACI|nr:GNAT family N-acetyltransferase [Niallia nealsonii]PKG25649.1 GNAT family N-acetyltransferase [Niallia nealsonii]
MLLYSIPVNEKTAAYILSWRYPSPYDLYNDTGEEESLKEFLENPYFAVINEMDEIIGFYCIGYSAQVPNGYLFGVYEEGYLDIGLGMKPELIGKGYGASFLAFILYLIEKKYGRVPLRLTVATFNERAIHLYEKFGFAKRMMFDDMITTFQTMVKEDDLKNIIEGTNSI